jgi:hypothetical protein
VLSYQCLSHLEAEPVTSQKQLWEGEGTTPMSIEAVVKNIKDEILRLQSAVAILNGKRTRQTRRKMSAAARQRISIAQKKRWREQKRAA